VLRALKTIAEAEKEAQRIIDAANIQAQEVRRKVAEEAEKAYEETYRQVIIEAKQRAAEAEKKAKSEAEHKTKTILQQAEEQLTSIRAKVKENFDKAVNAALGEVLA
jgi:F0F1-type ATP synthase membrane subunit b/b'